MMYEIKGLLKRIKSNEMIELKKITQYLRDKGLERTLYTQCEPDELMDEVHSFFYITTKEGGCLYQVFIKVDRRNIFSTPNVLVKVLGIQNCLSKKWEWRIDNNE